MKLNPFRQQVRLVCGNGARRAPLYRTLHIDRIYHARRCAVASNLDLCLAVAEYVDVRRLVIVEENDEAQPVSS